MLKNRIQYILLIFLAAGFCILFDSTLMLLLLPALVLLPLCSCLLLFAARRKVSLDAEAPLTADGAPEIVYTLKNECSLPVAAVEWELLLENRMNGGTARQNLRCFLGGGKRTLVHLRPANARTGKLIATTRKAKMVDFLGLFAFSLALPRPLDFYIYPKVFPIEQILPNRVETDGDNVTYSQHKSGPDVNEIFSLHEYVEGDDLRKVHWKLSSKIDRLMVREFGLPLNSQATLLTELMPVRRFDESGELSFSLDIYASLSAALAQMGIIHHIAWYDRRYDVVHAEQITGIDDLYQTLPALLDAEAYEHEPQALLHYANNARSDTAAMLYYITTRPDMALISQAASTGPMKVIVACGAHDRDDVATNARADGPEVIRIADGTQTIPFL